MSWNTNMLYRFINQSAILILLIQILVSALFIRYGGIYFSTPKMEPSKADLIVILGGGTSDRLKKSIELYKQGFANKFLITGFPALNQESMPIYIKWRIQYLIDSGIPENKLLFDSSATSSVDEAILVRDYLIKHQAYKAIIISDPPHLRRLSYIYRSIFASYIELNYLLVASEPDWWDAKKWWKNKHSAQFTISEIIKFSYFFVNSIFSSRG